MSFRSKSLILAAVALVAALGILLAPRSHGPTIAADRNDPTSVRSAQSPVAGTMKIVPAEVLGTGVIWAPPTGEN